MPDCTTAVFEGAQGVLLDEYRGFHPHTTWSTVTAHHAWELVEQAGAQSVCVLGITRSYTTRHGAGPLPTFSEELTERLRDPGNPHNPWQGSLRCGWLDLPLLRYAAAAAGPLDGMVVNHLDQVSDGWQVCEGYREGEPALADGPDLARQEELTRRLSEAEPVLRGATADEVVRARGGDRAGGRHRVRAGPRAARGGRAAVPETKARQFLAGLHPSKGGTATPVVCGAGFGISTLGRQRRLALRAEVEEQGQDRSEEYRDGEQEQAGRPDQQRERPFGRRHHSGHSHADAKQAKEGLREEYPHRMSRGEPHHRPPQT